MEGNKLFARCYYRVFSIDRMLLACSRAAFSSAYPDAENA